MSKHSIELKQDDPKVDIIFYAIFFIIGTIAPYSLVHFAEVVAVLFSAKIFVLNNYLQFAINLFLSFISIFIGELIFRRFFFKSKYKEKSNPYSAKIMSKQISFAVLAILNLVQFIILIILGNR